jgi:hypothetical protein
MRVVARQVVSSPRLYACTVRNPSMKREIYAAARAISPKLHAYFARHREDAIRRGQEHLAPLPDAETIEAIIDAAFWASLRREEGYSPRISLAVLAREEAGHPLILERVLPLSPGALTRVSPAVERPGVHLGVWRDQDGLCVWGTTRTTPVLCFVLEVAAPGLLVVKHHSGEEARKFVNVAVLEGDQIRVVDEGASRRPECPAMLTSLLGFNSPAAWVQSVNTMVQLAVSMPAHGRGGSLLVVPAATDSWRESIMQPITYAVSPPSSDLADLSRQTPVQAERLGPAIAAVAGLTAVDGAVVLSDRRQLDRRATRRNPALALPACIGPLCSGTLLICQGAASRQLSHRRQNASPTRAPPLSPVPCRVAWRA